LSAPKYILRVIYEVKAVFNAWSRDGQDPKPAFLQFYYSFVEPGFPGKAFLACAKAY
jgi:hypothetical protein